MPGLVVKGLRQSLIVFQLQRATISQPGGAISHAWRMCASSAEKGGFITIRPMWLTWSAVISRKSLATVAAGKALLMRDRIARSCGSRSQ